MYTSVYTYQYVTKSLKKLSTQKCIYIVRMYIFVVLLEYQTIASREIHDCLFRKSISIGRQDPLEQTLTACWVTSEFLGLVSHPRALAIGPGEAQIEPIATGGKHLAIADSGFQKEGDGIVSI